MRLEILHVVANVARYSRKSGTVCKNLPKCRGNLFDTHPFGIGQRSRSPAFVQHEQNKLFRIRRGFAHFANQQSAYGTPFPEERSGSRIGSQNILQFHGPLRGQVAIQSDRINMFKRRRHENIRA